MQKIIVLDDNEDILEAVSFVLKQKSIDVVTLSDPTLLEQHIPLDQPALLLMDIFLGGYDGRVICRKLKDNRLYDHISIVLFSAQICTPESLEESGADAMLNKPFSLQTLIGILERLDNK